MSATLQRIATPFVVFLGDARDEVFGKTGFGVVQWRRQDCVGQIRLAECMADTGIPDLDVDGAQRAGARSLIIGSAAVGGRIPENWIPTVCAAAAAGIDIVAGLHMPLEEIPGLAEAARRGGARLVNVRVPPPNLPVGTGRKRSGRRVLTVGTDCACGKKYTALALNRDLRRHGVKSTFRATGQTGIMIAGEGMPIDAVVADFLTGAAEILSPDNDPDHWDVIEGQGALFHPGYLQVTHGLLVGSQPDAFVVCHDPLRTQIEGWEDFPLPSIGTLIERVVALGRLTNPQIRCVGVSLNTSKLPASERTQAVARYRQETGLPCVDPIAMGTDEIVAQLLQEFPQPAGKRSAAKV
jgi:uncharacterized NAD-dependent epimerase/dehydratase family protein